MPRLFFYCLCGHYLHVVCAVTSRNIIIYMFADNHTGIIFSYKHVAIFAPDTAYIFGVI